MTGDRSVSCMGAGMGFSLVQQVFEGGVYYFGQYDVRCIRRPFGTHEHCCQSSRTQHCIHRVRER